ncbi:F0F1 ATP synthase subunit A [Acidiphilium acidophilum]|jgi:F-type H+-transporting ATPase subunit a|uniref:ATP synthase subunit a n=1 Tax=Acidiphilium acidophilum TaxID=76588 RepID=A0AAW9DNT0_ACIAO|nr:F0F1 ATP synthase subunit A [Acidiphilium acidophilum]MDX5930824.1 F0F1 ATP synthase subunit A [Acidiphilium acidophilum]GBR75490.1 ATP synthase F0F1 subunit alpha [Acidiphilium acidophilum DSM 700]
MAQESAINALGQFQLTTGFGPVGRLVGFTNSNEMMLLAAAIITMLFTVALRRKAIVPGRMQGLVEMSYDFVLQMVDDTIGSGGRRFFPFIFTLFSFILVGNLLGLFPYFFAFTSHIAITGALALFVFLLSTTVGFWYHGLGFLKFFSPPGVPGWLLPLLIPIEIVSFLSRPISLSVRLFANITAGHVMWEVFAGFMIMLVTSLGAVGVVAAIIPLGLNVALTALEFLVAFLQAYVFAVLTCLYLHDAIHLH